MFCTKCTAEAWNWAAQKYRDERTEESHAAAKKAQKAHENALKHEELFSELVTTLDTLRHAVEHEGEHGRMVAANARARAVLAKVKK